MATVMRPKKPYSDFPLTPHPTGKWQKKINGRTRYFGNWARRSNGQLVAVEEDGWRDALEEYKKYSGANRGLPKFLQEASGQAKRVVDAWPSCVDPTNLPDDGPAVYALVDKGGVVVYVGSTSKTVLHRLVEQNHKLYRRLKEEVTVYYSLVCEFNRLRVESWLISSLDPVFNRTYAATPGRSKKYLPFVFV